MDVENDTEVNSEDIKDEKIETLVSSDVFKTVDSLFQSIDEEYRRVIKLCFSSLIIFTEASIRSSYGSENTLNYTRFSSILTYAAFILWTELLDIDGGMENIETPDSSSDNNMWKMFITENERRSFFDAVKANISENKKQAGTLQAIRASSITLKKNLNLRREAFKSTISQKINSYFYGIPEREVEDDQLSENTDNESTDAAENSIQSDSEEQIIPDVKDETVNSDIVSTASTEIYVSSAEKVNDEAALKFICAHLARIGLLKFACVYPASRRTRRNIDINGSDFLSEIPQYICISQDTHYQYGQLLADTYVNDGGFSVESRKSTIVLFNQTMAQACLRKTIHNPILKDFTENEGKEAYEKLVESGESNDSLFYAFMMLPSHLIRADMEVKALESLRSDLLMNGRIAINFKEIIRRYQQDCEELRLKPPVSQHISKESILSLYQRLENLLEEKYPLACDDKNGKHGVGKAFNILAKYYSMNMWLEDALKYYEKSLEYKKSADDQGSNISRTMRSIGTLNLKLGNNIEGMKYYEEALQLDKTELGENTLSVAGTVKNMAIMYVAHGEYEKAILAYEEALNIEKERLGDDHYHVANTYNKLGIVYSIKQRYSKAIFCYNECLRITKAQMGEKDPLVADLLYRLGRMHFRKGDFIEARKSLAESLKCRKSNFGEDHDDVVRSLHALAISHAHLGELKEAIDCYEEVLRSRRRKNHEVVIIAQTLFDLALALKACGRLNEAYEYLNEIISILEKKSNESLVAAALDIKGSISRQQNNLDDAMEFYQESLELKKKLLGVEHIEIAESMHNIGDIFMLQNKLDEAKSCYENAYNIRVVSLGTNHLDIASTRNNIGIISLRRNEIENAILCFTESLIIRQGRLGFDNELVADMYQNLGIAHEMNKQFNLSLKQFEEALRIRRLTLGDKDAKVADTLYSIGVLNAMKGKISTSLKCIEKADKIYEIAGYDAETPSRTNCTTWSSYLQKKLQDSSN